MIALAFPYLSAPIFLSYRRFGDGDRAPSPKRPFNEQFRFYFLVFFFEAGSTALYLLFSYRFSMSMSLELRSTWTSSSLRAATIFS
jgi:hypothetical protein